jgi:hypothetical protein
MLSIQVTLMLFQEFLGVKVEPSQKLGWEHPSILQGMT